MPIPFMMVNRLVCLQVYPCFCPPVATANWLVSNCILPDFFCLRQPLWGAELQCQEVDGVGLATFFGLSHQPGRHEAEWMIVDDWWERVVGGAVRRIFVGYNIAIVIGGIISQHMEVRIPKLYCTHLKPQVHPPSSVWEFRNILRCFFQQAPGENTMTESFCSKGRLQNHRKSIQIT